MIRLRVSAMSCQGTSGWRIWVSGVTFLAASPRISSSRVKARAVSASGSRLLTFLPCASSSARRAASSICLKRAASSSLGRLLSALILHFGLLQHLVTEIAAEAPVGVQVHLTAEKLGEFALQPDEA